MESSRQWSSRSLRISSTSAGRYAQSARFPAEYWRELEPDRYPEDFVQALTSGGWLGGLIPEQYGGAGLDLTAASVILEEINHSGWERGRVPRSDVHHDHDPESRERRTETALPSSDRLRRAAAPGVWRDRAERRFGFHADRDARRARLRRRVSPVRSKGVHVQSAAFGSDAGRCQDRSLRECGQANGRTVRVHRGHPGPTRTGGDPTAPNDGEPPHDRGLLRRPRDSTRRPGRGGGQRIPLPPRQPQCRTHPHRV